MNIGVGLGMAMAKQQHLLMEQQINRLMDKPKRKAAFGGVNREDSSNALVVHQPQSPQPQQPPQRRLL